MIPNEIPGFNFDLGETVDLLRDTVRSFSDDEIAPRANLIEQNNDFPKDLWTKLGDIGVLGITVEEEYGGAGMGYFCLLYTSPSPRDQRGSRMPSSG